MTRTIKQGDRVRHKHDPQGPAGTVTEVDEDFFPALGGAMYTVKWDDGYTFSYTGTVLVKDDA